MQQLRPSVPIDNGTQGASSELRVVIDLISKGYMVFRNQLRSFILLVDTVPLTFKAVNV